MSHWGIVTKPGEKPPEPVEVPQQYTARPTMPAWSYSRLAKWEKCPASAYYAFILRMPEPSSEAMTRGTLMHEHAARVLKGDKGDVSALTLPWVARLTATRRTYGEDIETELQIAYRKDWTETEWFAKDAWCRIVFDAMIVKPGTDTVLVQEHKSGKPRAEHTAQASLYAAGASLLVPGRAVEVTINYLDLNPDSEQGVVRHHFAPEFATKQVKVWTDRAQRMLTDTEYPATPGRHCQWCAFSQSKGGPCVRG